MLLSIRGGRRRHISSMYHQVFASYLKPSSIFLPILPPVSSRMAALRNSAAFYNMRLKPGAWALILTKEHNFPAGIWNVASSARKAMTAENLADIPCRIHSRIIVHPAPELHACQGSHLSNSRPGDHRLRDIWWGNRSGLLLLRNTGKSNSICAAASAPHAFSG